VGLAYNLFNKFVVGVSKLTGEPLQYAQDGVYTVHNAEFLKDERFRNAYRLGLGEDHNLGPNPHIEWRVYVCCWALKNARMLEGDFVECGVNTGILSRAAVEYADFGQMKDRTLYLMDTFEGIPESQFVDAERAMGLDKRYVYGDTFAAVQQKFSKFPNVRLVKGRIPESLSEVKSTKIAYLSIDMNAAAPEVAALEYFWPKLVDGAVVVFDDYNWRLHVNQKRAIDQFVARVGSEVLALPTGQGLIVKT